MVLANITSRAISDYSPGFFKILKPRGQVIVSGIHPEGLDEVLISLVVAGFNLEAVDNQEQWHAVTASKGNN